MKRRAAGAAVWRAALVALAFPGAVAHAGWGPEPVGVYSTSSVCPQVAACRDDGYGAFVVWQESGGPLLATHLLGSGDLDPNWPPYVTVNATAVNRSDVRAIADEAGGAWVTWRVGSELHVEKFDASGATADGWAGGDRIVGSSIRPPAVLLGGQGSLLLAGIRWTQVTDPGGQLLPVIGLVIWNLQSDGTPSAGWPATGRGFGPNADSPLWLTAFGLARTPSGHLWAAWAGCRTQFDWNTFEEHVQSGDIRVLRLDADGTPAAGWDSNGLSLGPYPRSDMDTSAVYPGPLPWWHTSGMNLVAVCADQGEGAYVAYPFDESFDPYEQEVAFRPTIVRLDPSGNAEAGWPVSVNTHGYYTNTIGTDLGEAASIRLFADDQDGCLIAYPQRFTDSPDFMDVAQVTTHGIGLWSMWNNTKSFEVFPNGIGGLWWTSYYPGPAGIWTYYVHVLCEGSDAGAFYESQGSSPLIWYGDTGLAAGYGDGSAIFCWSQQLGRQGVFAVRINRAGPVTDAPQAVAAPATRLWLRFAPGAGVRVSLALAGTGETRLLLADVTGRAVARETFALGAGAREWTIMGTATLAPGLYFARVTRGAETLTARVVVTR